jgi:hypothetical protein
MSTKDILPAPWEFARETLLTDCDPSTAKRRHKHKPEGFPNFSTGSPSASKPTLKTYRAMQRFEGELVHLTLKMPHLNCLEWRSGELQQAAKAETITFLKSAAPSLIAYHAAIRRGGRHDGIHVHTVLPISSLTPKLQAAARAAPSGKGGGVELDGFHVVRVNEGKDDLERLASYLCSDGDERYRMEQTDPEQYQAAHHDALERKISGMKVKRMTWTVKPAHWQ